MTHIVDPRRRLPGVAALALTATIALAACGSTSSKDTSGSAAGAKQSTTKVAWLFFGPKSDGGYNVSQWQPAQATIRKRLGGRVDQVETDNIPYTEQLSQITEQYMASGAKLVIDTVSGGDLFTDVCAKHPEVHCIESNPLGPYPAAAKALPDNVSGVYLEYWNPTYLLGMAAGMLTKTGTIGFVGAYNIPVQNASANAYLLGCQRVRPSCKLRRVNINNYYDPSKTAEATRSLINTGADVIHGWTDDPSFCEVAQQKHVRALGNFYDYRKLCPDAYAGGLTWTFGSTYYPDEVASELNGKWTGHRTYWAKLGQGADLAPWGKDVPQNVQDTVKKVYDEIRAGTNVFRGPLYDNKGRLQVKAGATLDGNYLYNKWKWALRGTT
jgi:basic membrane protein A and related proteins